MKLFKICFRNTSCRCCGRKAPRKYSFSVFDDQVIKRRSEEIKKHNERILQCPKNELTD